MLITFTPISAQSLMGSSLTIMLIWPVGVLEPPDEELEEPQPANRSGRANRSGTSTRVILEFMEFSLRSLRRFRSLLFFCCVMVLWLEPDHFGAFQFRPVTTQNTAEQI